MEDGRSLAVSWIGLGEAVAPFIHTVSHRVLVKSADECL
jgi:hypothetical protein